MFRVMARFYSPTRFAGAPLAGDHSPLLHTVKGEGAQELLRALCLGVVEERLRRALLDDFAAVQEDDTIRNRAGKLHLVGDNDHRAALLRQIEHNVQHLADHFGVKGCSHFIEQQNFGCIASARTMATRCFWPPDNSRG